MAGFADQQAMTQDANFRNVVKIAMAKVASQIQGESMGGMTDAQWRKRAALATNVLSAIVDPAGNIKTGLDIWLESFAYVTAQNATIGDTVIPWAGLDSDIEFQVTAIWDDVAGVTGVDLT